MKKIIKKTVVMAIINFAIVGYCKAQTTSATVIDSVKIEFVGDANIQKSFTQGEGIPANTGLGLNFRKIFPTAKSGFLNTSRFELEIVISIASTVDTIKASVYNEKVRNQREFGSFILFPVNSGQAASANVKGYFEQTPSKTKVTFLRGDGYMIRVGASNRVLALNDSMASNAAALTLRFGTFYEFMPNDKLDDYSITFSPTSLFVRRILGDIAQNDNDDLRNKLFGTYSEIFCGWEPNVQIKLKNIKAEFGFPIVFDQRNVKALSGGQFATSIGFSGGFSLKL